MNYKTSINDILKYIDSYDIDKEKEICFMINNKKYGIEYLDYIESSKELEIGLVEDSL